MMSRRIPPSYNPISSTRITDRQQLLDGCTHIYRLIDPYQRAFDQHRAYSDLCRISSLIHY